MERRLAAIFAADVVGYSRLMGEDEEGTLQRLNALRHDLVEPNIAGRKGRIVKLMGDGLLAEFSSVVEAIQCAVDIQSEIAERETDVAEENRVTLRIGINLGDVIVEGSDIFGEGVNVAARLEGLADPGGVCISAAAFRAVEGKIDLAFEDLGPQAVKNIAKPVHVYRLAGTPGKEDFADHAQDGTSLSGKPSIAVLPFTNMSGDPEQDYFSDGITEDIITELSRNRWMTVIARNTTFTYKGMAVNVANVARDLGVRYVIEGSVRKSSERMRINVQLIEGSTGNHVWAERFDRQVVDIFDLQDEITRRIAAAIEPEIFAIEGHNASRRNVTDLSVWEDMMRARVYFGRTTAADTSEAIRLLSDILENHSDVPLANSLLSFMYLFSVHMGWLPPDPYKERADRLARKAVTLDEQDTWGHIALGYVRMMERRTGAAVSELTRALDLNPNSATAYGYRGLTNAFGARNEAALEDASQAIRLSPRDSQLPIFLAAQTVAKFHQRDFEEALRLCEEIVEMRPEFVGALRLKSSMLAHCGRIDEAQQVLNRVLELQPDLNLAALEQAQPYATEEGMRLFLEGMKMAGLN